MTEPAQLVSKVLILDNSTAHYPTLKQYCDDHQLVGLKPSGGDVVKLLSSYVDLGAIFIADDYCGTLDDTLNLIERIHYLRTELPIALRRSSDDSTAQQLETISRNCSALFSADDLSPLNKLIQDHIFCLVYPNSLVRGISEISCEVFANQFSDYTLTFDTPYLVRDRIIFGEVFTLIPLESSWCNGYMMLQTDIQSEVDPANIATLTEDSPRTFHKINGLFSEITNMIWGGFKRRFINDNDDRSQSRAQVPILANYHHKYISFGTENPHLCFKYSLTDKKTDEVITIYQWFVFNISWSPSHFHENTQSVDSLIESGELELF